ncbi:glycosyltransferase [Pseudodesulfovibrio sp. F-1]|uniref:Glycosyltransferase n=1 Tax=Pseudodesulfovibrio alkaliphilus TaxID=2661613 RepID=A0A7K1KN96_9BACT|nr:glycosyltransferase [Pseudodesulfovibrio alkaliphilus]MUM77539.1 glycosyltransferase [Pseudodesulfovibrio alkaliphilus]
MNILIVVWNLTLGRGGRQRAGAALASEMARRGHSITVLVNDAASNPPLFPLDPTVRLVRLNTDAHLEYRKKLLRHRNDPAFHAQARALVKTAAPDLVMVMSSSREILMWPLILDGTSIPLVLAERTDPSFMANLCWETPQERLAVLTAADIILLQMEGFRSYYPTHLQDRLRITPNQVAPATLQADPAGRSRDVKTIINIARLDMHKHQPLLAHAFGLVSAEFPDWDLHFWGGDGILAAELRETILCCGVEGRAHVHQTTADVESRLAEAHIFAFPSEFEGCPNALLEAQAHGLPSIGYRGCGGTNEIIRHDENGLLFDILQPASLAASLRTLMNDSDLRERMGRAAKQNAARFAPERVYDLFEQTFLEAAAFKGRPRRDASPTSEAEKAARSCLAEIYTRDWI